MFIQLLAFKMSKYQKLKYANKGHTWLALAKILCRWQVWARYSYMPCGAVLLSQQLVRKHERAGGALWSWVSDTIWNMRAALT